MRPPRRVRIGPISWYVRCSERSTREMRKKDRRLLGHTDGGRATLTVAHDLPADLKRETLLHEIMHAVYYLTGNPLHRKVKGDREELGISALSPGLLGVLRDNPELVEYLTGVDQ